MSATTYMLQSLDFLHRAFRRHAESHDGEMLVV